MSGEQNKLTLAKTFALGELIKTEYVKSDLSDPDFAKHATEKLGFEVNSVNTASVRAALGIVSWAARRKAETPETIVERLAAAERAIGKLIRRVDSLEEPGQ